jgi:cytochrome P450
VSGSDIVTQPVNVTDLPSGSGAVSPLGVLGSAFTMVGGGIDTIAGLPCGALEALSIRRDQRRVLLGDPAMVPANEWS